MFDPAPSGAILWKLVVPDSPPTLVPNSIAVSTLPSGLSRWLESVAPPMLARLVRAGIIDQKRTAASKPLEEHVDDWKLALLNKGNSSRDVEQKINRVSDVFNGCKFSFWSDIAASLLSNYLNARKSEKRFGNQTFNFYLQASKQFCSWMVREGRVCESPLSHLQNLNVKTDRRHDRRAGTVEELRCLLAATMSGPERWGMTGEARAMLYRLAAESGLRSSELRSLTRSSFRLDGVEPSVTIEAAYAKGRRKDTLPLRNDTSVALGLYLANKMPNAPAFAMPVRTEVSRMFYADVADAREGWLMTAESVEQRMEWESTPFLAIKTGQKGSTLCLDFHSFRHTFISNLVAGGVHPKTAQTLARHGTIGLTMDRYTHVRDGATALALNVLPCLELPKVQIGLGANVCESILSPGLSPALTKKRSLTEFTGVKVEGVRGKAFPSKSRLLTGLPLSGNLFNAPRRSGRVVECAGLENRWASNGPVSSNLTSSVENDTSSRCY